MTKWNCYNVISTVMEIVKSTTGSQLVEEKSKIQASKGIFVVASALQGAVLGMLIGGPIGSVIGCISGRKLCLNVSNKFRLA